VTLQLKMVGMKHNSPKKYLDTLFILQLSEYLCIKKNKHEKCSLFKERLKIKL